MAAEKLCISYIAEKLDKGVFGGADHESAIGLLKILKSKWRIQYGGPKFLQLLYT